MRAPTSIVAVATLALMFLGQPVRSQEPVPVGVQGQVNTFTADSQVLPAVGMDAQGNFVVVWQSPGSDTSDSSETSIQGRVFTSNGVPVGPDAQINSYTTDLQRIPKVGVDAQGNFVVVWYSFGSDHGEVGSYGIQGQRYDSSLQKIDGEFQINTYMTGEQIASAVAVDPDGDFVVVWQSEGSRFNDVGSYSIQARRFGSDGVPAGDEFQVNSYTTDDQTSPAVGMGADGAFVVVWRSVGSTGGDNSGSSIQARRYSSDGVPAGEEFQVNTYTTERQSSPDIGVDDGGDFVVVWSSRGSGESDNDETSVQGRFFSANGLPRGQEFQANTHTMGDQWAPAVAIDDEGNSVVLWESDESGGNDNWDTSIQGRVYASNGLPVGPEGQVNTYTTGYQKTPAVGVDAEGHLVVVWSSLGSSGSDTSNFSIQGQRFIFPFLFADGFDSGDTTAWSSSIP